MSRSELHLTCCICRAFTPEHELIWRDRMWVCQKCAPQALGEKPETPLVMGGQGHSCHADDVYEFMCFVAVVMWMTVAALLVAFGLMYCFGVIPH